MFTLPSSIKEKLGDFRKSLQDYIDDKITPAYFKGIRVPWGIYSQRGGEFYMVRIRIPAGLITPSQIKILASVSKKYGGEALHLTTRQDIQIHDVRIEDTIEIMQELEKYNLSPRGGGGNTVRNIIACPLSGICKDEIFNVGSYATSLTEYLLNQDTSFNLPRKFKISFSGCSKDCSGVLLNDLGFLATNNKKENGFKVFTGGGMGANSRIGKPLEEFIPVDDLGYCTIAVKNIFHRIGNRRNRHYNRLRFLIEEIGFKEFKKYYKEEFISLKEKEYIVLRKINFPIRQEVNSEIPKINCTEYMEFTKYNVQPQKQKGFQYVTLRIPGGDIDYSKFKALADLENIFENIEFRLSQNQNLIICGIKNQDIYKLFLTLKDIDIDFLYPETLLDVVSCRGALTCNLGLCNSPGLATVVEDMLRKNIINHRLFNKLEIKLNGCPNACGHHPLGKISFHGLVKKIDNRPVPFYKVLLGGSKDINDARLAKKIGVIPAKNIPDFLKIFLENLEGKIGDKKDLGDFLLSEGKEIAINVLKDFLYVPPYSENKSFFIDWGKTEEFSLANIGPGECGAGVIDIIESDLDEAKISLNKAEKENYSAKNIKRSILLACRALLVVKGIEATAEEKIILYFKNNFIKEGIASDYYSKLPEIFRSIDSKLAVEKRKDKFVYSKGFLKHINKLYKNMDSSFNFPKVKQKTIEKHSHFLDLKGSPCPINYVKAKVFLEGLEPKTTLEIFLDEGEPIDNVPRSLKSDGFKILKVEKLNGYYKVLVKNK